MDRMIFQRVGLLLLALKRLGLGSREAGGESSSNGMGLSGPIRVFNMRSSSSSDASFLARSAPREEAIAASAAALMDSVTAKVVCSREASSSTSHATSSTMLSQDRGRRTSILRQSHGLAPVYQARFTRHRLAKVCRATGSDQYPGGMEEGKHVGIPESLLMTSGSSVGAGAGSPAE